MNLGVRVTSPPAKEYNCIAWAAGDEKRFGYEECNTPDLEHGYRKVAIYAKDGIPTHAARQLDSGKWTSKLGKAEDVEHDALMLPYLSYGLSVLFLRRKKH